MMSLAALLVVLAYFTTQYFAIKWANGLSNPRTSLRRAIYCLSVAASGSSWVYFGSAGYAAKHGLESIALYIGIVLAFTLGFPLLQKIVQLSKAEGIKSISDFIGARYGKSFSVAAVVTVITTIGLIPYISLQITAVHYLIDIYCQSFDQIDLHSEVGVHIVVALVEIGIASYTVFYIAYRPLFKEQYDSLVHGLAFATLVKFVGLFIVGVAAVTFLYGSPFEIFARVISKREQLPMFQAPLSVSNSIGFILIGAASVLLLPNQFYMTIVQNRDDSELRAARWFVPLLLLCFGIFILPLAAIGSTVLPPAASGDFYFLYLPLAAGQNWLATIALVGGLPAATTMIIAPSILLSIMISNDLILPGMLRRIRHSSSDEPKDFTKIIPNIRRVALVGILAAAFAYQFLISIKIDFAAMALVSAIAVIQLLPPLVGGLVWRRGTARGAIWGMVSGFAVWAYTMVLPTLFDAEATFMAHGPFGIEMLRPHSLFGLDLAGFMNGMVWSLSANLGFFIAGSLRGALHHLNVFRRRSSFPRILCP